MWPEQPQMRPKGNTLEGRGITISWEGRREPSSGEEETGIWELGTEGTLALGPWKTEKPGSQSGRRENATSNPRFLDFQRPWAPALASPLVPDLFTTPVSPNPYLSGARVLKVTSCAGDEAERGAGPRGGGEPRRGPRCPMGETGLGTKMLGVGRCLGGPGAWSPGTRGAGRMAGRGEGRAGPARFRPCALPPASFLSASRPAFAPARCAPSFPAFLICPAPLASRGHPAAPAQVPWPLCTAPACGE